MAEAEEKGKDGILHTEMKPADRHEKDQRRCDAAPNAMLIGGAADSADIDIGPGIDDCESVSARSASAVTVSVCSKWRLFAPMANLMSRSTCRQRDLPAAPC